MFPAPIAAKIVQLLKDSGYRILGLDAFRLAQGKTQPLQEHSIDLSSENIALDSVISFLISQERENLYYEIIIH